MPIFGIKIELEFDVDYYEKKTNLTDQEIIDKVMGYVIEERNNLVVEAKIAAIKILNGEELE